MNYRYIPSAAGLTVWGIVLFVAGGAVSGWMSALAVRESFRDATSVFYSSNAEVYTGFAVLFAVVSIAGFVLLTVGISRAVKRADQRYDGWFRTLQPGIAAAPYPAPLPAAPVQGNERAQAPGPGTPSTGIPPMPMRGPAQPGR
ncbi:hypothetical protein [Arthrobacter sp. NPDC089319]|uniref:hypothetical protein n=1 Tax=Arthrobacter sp. NPDC089319 TaxID=3155915 RepID=UPI00344611BD